MDILPDSTSPIPEKVVETGEFHQALTTILRQLPADWREPFILHIRDGLSVEDVAQMEGLPIDEFTTASIWRVSFSARTWWMSIGTHCSHRQPSLTS